MVVPDKAALENWVAVNDEKSGIFRSLCENPKAKKYILDELNSTGQQQKVLFSILLSINL